MRILHVLDHSLPMHSGYSFRTRAILKAQIARGWQVAGVTGVRHIMPGPDSEIIDDLDFFRTPPCRKSLPILNELREVAALARRIEELVVSWQPDIIHAHSPVLNAMAAGRVARRHKIPFVYEIRAFWEDAAVGNGTGVEGSLQYRATRWLENRAVRSADAVAVICEGLRRDLIARGIDGDKIFLSPNGVDLGLFGKPARRDKALAKLLAVENTDVIGFIGSFYDYEGLDDLITAMPALVAKQPNIQLLLIGGGPMETALKAQVAASPVANHIRFIGRVPHDQVERYYSIIDILVYPRKKMRLTDLVTPLKPLEAMAQNRLVAASDVGGHRELIKHGETGTLFPPGNPAAMADALANMFKNKADWNAVKARGRAFVEQDRNWSSNISRYHRVYQKLLSDGFG